mgnify:CR=1 FL=1
MLWRTGEQAPVLSSSFTNDTYFQIRHGLLWQAASSLHPSPALILGVLLQGVPSRFLRSWTPLESGRMTRQRPNVTISVQTSSRSSKAAASSVSPDPPAVASSLAHADSQAPHFSFLSRKLSVASGLSCCQTSSSSQAPLCRCVRGSASPYDPHLNFPGLFRWKRRDHDGWEVHGRLRYRLAFLSAWFAPLSLWCVFAGISSLVIPVYLSEFAPPSIRGLLSTLLSPFRITRSAANDLQSEWCALPDSSWFAS